MEELISRIDEVQGEALRDIATIKDAHSADQCRIKYLGRKGSVTILFKGLGEVSPEEKRELGRRLNNLRNTIEGEITRLTQELSSREQSEGLLRERIDVTLPGRAPHPGKIHPLTHITEFVLDIFTGLGFSIYEGPEVETDYYNFEALNFLPDHPARDMQDTFFVDDGRVLRTHTSPVQIRVMEKMKPPVMMVAPGAVYRRDSDISHSPMFHQVEGLMVDHGVTFAHLKGVLSEFCHRCFGKNLSVRFRPSFFPFTEPSAEIDIECVMCKGKGCGICKQSGWLEILGCGMVDPNVYHYVHYDPKKVTGFAFGMGLERIAMLKYGINHIRLFFENDLRFLEQF